MEIPMINPGGELGDIRCICGASFISTGQLLDHCCSSPGGYAKHHRDTVGINSPRIENWSVQGDLYKPPECRTQFLVGAMFGHPYVPDGKVVNSSPIVAYDPGTNEVICTSRRYILGNIDPDYEKQYPDARERFINSWSKALKASS